jgi:predicted small lipoprotein YifL
MAENRRAMKYIRWKQFCDGRRFFIILPLLTVLLSSCGQKGDLMRPSAVKVLQQATHDSKKVQEQ